MTITIQIEDKNERASVLSIESDLKKLNRSGAVDDRVAGYAMWMYAKKADAALRRQSEEGQAITVRKPNTQICQLQGQS